MEILEALGNELSGNVLVIGYDDECKLVRTLKKSKRTEIVYTLNNNGNSILKRQNKKKKLNGYKDINIRKLNKELKKQKHEFDYVICNFEVILPFFRGFVKNSILISGKKLFIHNNIPTYNVDEIVYRYSRYGCKVKKEDEKKENLLTISTKNIKISKVKNFFYWFRDLFYDFFEFIANILIG